MSLRILLIVLMLGPAAGIASAQTPPLADLSLQDLLKIDVVSAVSKFAQETTKAPASITIITADEIRRFGYRDLADVLRSVRGLYITNDRNYTYVGVRGFARPGDYNTRVLLLVDGHRLNDPIYDMAPLGADLPVDIETIDRIEVIRGPGSSLYGTSAFFGVINVVTRSGAQEYGTRLDAESGTFGAFRARASTGHVFSNGVALLLGASQQRVGGPRELYFPEFDAPEFGGGIVRNGDTDRSSRVFGTLSLGSIVLRAGLGERTKRVPTGSFETVFGDTRLRTVDARSYADLAYTGPLVAGWSGVARVGYDQYRYDGWYPYEYGGDDGVQLLEDGARADWLSGELTANRRIGARHLFTTGIELRQVLRQDQFFTELGTRTTINESAATTWGAYLQDELTLTSKVLVNSGLRVDSFGAFGTQVTPRAALIYNPTSATALKLIHGRAFRAPNAYERYYFANESFTPDSLEPETTTMIEGVWEQYYGRRLRSTLSVFNADVNDLITQTRSSDDTPFTNGGKVRSRGIEAELETRLPNGITARASHAWTRLREDGTGQRMSNSPAQMAKYSLAVPIHRSPFSLAATGSYLGSRLTIRGGEIPGFYVQDITLTGDRLTRGMSLTLGVYNLFDRSYGDPGAEEHRQEQIPQNGRTIRVRASVRF